MTGLDLANARLNPVNGQGGWLLRLAGAVVWVPATTDAARKLVAACLDIDPPGELLTRLGRALIGPAAKDWPPFAVVASQGEDLVVLAHGPVGIAISHDGQQELLRGGDRPGSWASRTLGSLERVSTEEGDGGTDDLADLRLGVVEASGFVLAGVPGAEPVAEAQPASSAQASQPGPAGGLSSSPQLPGRSQTALGHAATAGQPSAPVAEAPVAETPVAETPVAETPVAETPVADDPVADDVTVVDRPVVMDDVTVVEAMTSAPAGGADAGGAAAGRANAAGAAAGAPGATVLGVNCPAGHFNDHRVTTCRRCGVALAAGAPKVEGPRPSLGTLTWDDGEVSPLGRRALVGRDASGDKDVAAGRALLVTPTGLNDSMSRVHAEMAASGWDVVVIDKGSTNGTFIWGSGVGEWRRLVPGEAQVVTSGTVIAFGERTATFDA